MANGAQTQDPGWQINAAGERVDAAGNIVSAPGNAVTLSTQMPAVPAKEQTVIGAQPGATVAPMQTGSLLSTLPREPAPLAPPIGAQFRQEGGKTVGRALPVNPEDQFQPIKDITPSSLANDPGIAQSIQSFRGTPLGNNEKGNPVYEKDGVRYVLLPGDQYHDIRVFGGGRTETAELPTGYYMPQIESIVANADGKDPWTGNKQYVDPKTGKPVATEAMTPQQKMDLAGRIQAFKEAKDPTAFTPDLINQRNMADAFDKMNWDMSQLNDDDINKMTQAGKGLADFTGADFAKIGGGGAAGEAKRRALIDLQAQMNYLQQTGQATLGREEKKPGEGIPQLPVPALATPATTGWLSGINFGIGLLNKAFTSGENFTQLRTTLPQIANATKRNYYQLVEGLANQNYRIDQPTRNQANRYMFDLEREGFDRTTNPLMSQPLKGSAVKAQIPQSEGEKLFTPRPVVDWLKQFAQPGRAPAPTQPQPPQPPEAGGRVMFQRGGLVTAPVSRAGPTMPAQIPSYASQAELDAAGHPSGTRFHWSPTGREYVTT